MPGKIQPMFPCAQHDVPHQPKLGLQEEHLTAMDHPAPCSGITVVTADEQVETPASGPLLGFHNGKPAPPKQTTRFCLIHPIDLHSVVGVCAAKRIALRFASPIHKC